MPIACRWPRAPRDGVKCPCLRLGATRDSRCPSALLLNSLYESTYRLVECSTARITPTRVCRAKAKCEIYEKRRFAHSDRCSILMCAPFVAPRSYSLPNVCRALTPLPRGRLVSPGKARPSALWRYLRLAASVSVSRYLTKRRQSPQKRAKR